MHPCLYVDEIVRLIAHELVASKGLAASVALACCCKSFEDPALDALWETDGRLFRLFKSFPEDVWDGEKCTVSALTTHASSFLNYLVKKRLKRPPTTLEWTRFRKYARRIRKLRQSRNLYTLPFEFSHVPGQPIAEPLLPNLETLDLRRVNESFLPFILPLLSPRTTTISITLIAPNRSKAPMLAASVIAALPTICPSLQTIELHQLERDPIITDAVSEMLLATNQNTLQYFHADSPLTEEAREVFYKLPCLRGLWTVIEGPTSLPTVTLPNLAKIIVKYEHDHDWLQGFRGAMLGELVSVAFLSESKSIGDFLGAFESVALTTSIPATLRSFRFNTSRPWSPKYHSLLSFTQLKTLAIRFHCGRSCSSTIDDDTITEIARVMPKLKVLRLGGPPCQAPTGVTAKGLAALAYHCPHLSVLRIHFQVARLELPATPEVAFGEPAIPRGDCALTTLHVGKIHMPEESALMVARTLLHIFPRIDNFECLDNGWRQVIDAINASKQPTDRSGKKPSLAPSRSKVDDTFSSSYT